MEKPTIAVILCAGKGTRMGALTEHCPKPLLPLSTGETLLEIKLHALPASITKVILIIGYKGEMIREKIGTTYEGKEIIYIEQDIEKSYGTGAALALCKDTILGNSFLVLMGDDIYAKEDLEKLCMYKNAVLLAHLGEAKYGAPWQAEVFEDVFVTFHEKIPPTGHQTGIINTAAYVFSPEYFSVTPVTGADGEVQIPPTILLLMKHGVVFNTVKATLWKQVTAPEDLVV
jgi:NDP-sugar pyrophosphorylase family protein